MSYCLDNITLVILQTFAGRNGFYIKRKKEEEEKEKEEEGRKGRSNDNITSLGQIIQKRNLMPIVKCNNHATGVFTFQPNFY